MRETVKKGLVYAAGLVIMGLSLIPANLPFTLALKKIGTMGYSSEIGKFLQDSRLDHLPLSLAEKFFYTFFPFIFLLLVLGIIWKVFHRKSLLSLVTGAPRFRYRNLITAFVLWALFSLVGDIFFYLLNPEIYRISFQLLPWLKLISLGFLFITPQVILEEAFFRSYLIKGGTALTGQPLIPLIMVSLIFGLLHTANPEVKTQGFLVMMPQYMGMGLFLAFLAWDSDGLEIPLGIHLANNSWGILVVNAGGTAFETPSPVFIQSWNALASLVALALSLLLFLTLYKKTKMFSKLKEKRFFRDN
jgi:membrane protease YdiL (CAAX protease family)